VKPYHGHLTAAKRVLRYLKATADVKLVFPSTTLTEAPPLVRYTDSDFAGDRADGMSQGGHIFKVYGAAISWLSRKQGLVSFSTTEAEYIAVTARRRRHHLSRTTRLWNVLDGAAQGRFGFWVARRGKVLVARRGKVLVARRGMVLVAGRGKVLGARRGKVLVARRGKVLGARRGKVLLVLVARREEGSGCGGSRSLYIRVRCCLSCMFLLHATCSTEAQWN